MKYLDLPKPHGFLIWRGKQKAIASDKPLPSGESLLLISNGEAFGELMLGQPVAMNLNEFEAGEDYHCTRPEERKLFWPDSDVFYVHRFKSWKPYETWHHDDKGNSKRVMPAVSFTLNGNEAELTESPELTPEQEALLVQAERLPKTLILLDEAVTLEGDKTILSDGLDSSRIEPVIRAVLDGANLDGSLALYQLALVRIPKMSIKKKALEAKTMPYKPVKNHPECDEDKPVGLVGPDGKLTGCHEDMQAAMAQAEAIMAEEKGRTKPKPKEGSRGKPKPKTKEFDGVVEDEKCGPEMGYSPYGAIFTFADAMALEEAQEAMYETQKLTSIFSTLAHNIMDSPDITDKGAALKALADEYAGLVGEAMAEKAYRDKWGEDMDSRDETKAEEIEMKAWLEEWKEWAVRV